MMSLKGRFLIALMVLAEVAILVVTVMTLARHPFTVDFRLPFRITFSIVGILVSIFLAYYIHWVFKDLRKGGNTE